MSIIDPISRTPLLLPQNGPEWRSHLISWAKASPTPHARGAGWEWENEEAARSGPPYQYVREPLTAEESDRLTCSRSNALPRSQVLAEAYDERVQHLRPTT